MIPLCIPSIRGNEEKYVVDCIRKNYLTVGTYLSKFEIEITKYCGVKYAVACSSGTAALHISLLLSGVKKNDEIIVPSITFISPINVVKYVNAHPVFMDCKEDYNLDVDKLEKFLTEECDFNGENTINKSSNRIIRAIVPVHVFGNPVDMYKLMELCNKFNLNVVEDATESLGTKYNGKSVGTFGKFGCFSFNGNKIITSAGGGMIVTDDKTLAEKARYLINQAKDDTINFVHSEIGYNYRLSNIHAAIGLAQLEKLNEIIEIKKKNFKIYESELKDSGYELLKISDNSNHWFYALKIKEGQNKEELIEYLESKGVITRSLWTPCHLQEPYKEDLAYEIKMANKLFNQTINIPCSSDLTEEEVKQVCKILKEL